ncbi:kinase-like domain-containing protein [Plectosphaerella plurivora]|uniref:Kinase-like domain-containing protein n=1 Tax=Plectosphaerella plurivora TaxID=936078 RepID=A0A9P8VL11_9PEZI|nr:kinase-like domain-containing protein [Plectosphaerella plurivora]
MGQSFSIGSFLTLQPRLWFGQKLFRPLEHTSVPVPRLYEHHILDGLIYIEMAYIPDTTLDAAWPNLLKDQKSTIFADIKLHVSALRELGPPSQDIHLRLEDLKTGVLGQEIATTHLGRYRTCFTHADLAPRNIIVGDGQVAAIIDWGFAGWYPEYWEYTRAHYNYVSEEWEEYLSEALPVYSTELAAERTLWRMLPEPGSRFSGPLSDGTTFTRKGTAPSEEWLAARSNLQSPDLWSLALKTRR